MNQNSVEGFTPLEALPTGTILTLVDNAYPKYSVSALQETQKRRKG